MVAYDLTTTPPTLLYSKDITPVTMRRDPVTGADVTVNEKQRTALAVSDGNSVVGWGGLSGDCNQYHGYLETVSEADGTPRALWTSTVETDGREGALWEPSGPAVDSDGDIFVTTGNGNSGTTENPDAPYDCSDAVLRFDPSLTMTSLFVPQNWRALNNGDGDLGSVGPVLLPGGMLFQIGKAGMGYLLRQTLPDSVPQPPPDAPTYCPADPDEGGANASAQVCPATTDATFGATAVMGNVVYIGCSDGVRAVSIDSATSFHTLWTWAGANGHPSDIVDGVPTIAGGLVWAGGLSGDPTLCGLDPATGVDRVCLQLPAHTAHFATPVAADGELFIADGTQVAAYEPPPVSAAPSTGGYDIDGFGGVHAFGAASVAAGYGYWPPNDRVRGAVLRQDRTGGLEVLGDGTLVAFGTQTPVAGAQLPFDIARGIALDPCDGSGGSGYVLDGFGGLHPFGSAPPVITADYWPGWDIARAIVVNPCSGGAITGFFLDGFGGLHAFWQTGTPGLRAPVDTGYWPGWDIARSIVLTGPASGQMLDGWGGLHAFGGASAAADTAWHPGQDSSRVVSMIDGTQGGYVLDATGTITGWSVRGTSPPPPPSGVANFGFPIARGLAA